MAFGDGIVSSNVVGYATKEQASDADYKVISFQWDAVNGSATRSLQEAIKPSVGGTAWESAEAENCIQGWTDNAPMIQIRDETGGYTLAWYATEGYDLESGEMYPAWCDSDGFVMKHTTVPVSAGFWLWAPSATPNVYLTVKNPIK